ncbi:MAG: class I SAM-dependent methyltransferase [Actinomycetota bacterium]|nr:class I SAM-dependent methyltransferase [Actinomycetota bacterium]
MTGSFNEYKDTYGDEVQHSIRFVRQSHDFFTESKARHLVALTERHLGPTEGLTALDVGCGVGVTDRLIAPRFKEVHGVDVAEDVVERAAAENPDVAYRTYDGTALPYADGTFDVVFAICVLHHVDVATRGAFVAEMKRVARHPGLVMIFEHNPINPLTRLAVARCDFDEDVVLLTRREVASLSRRAGLSVVDARYILFLPWMIELSQKLDRVLGRLPLGAQHVTVAATT